MKESIIKLMQHSMMTFIFFRQKWVDSMIKLSTFQLVPGMTLAENVYSYNQQLILSQGTILTDNLISRLDLYGILTVSVTDGPITAASIPSEFATLQEDSSYSQRVKSSPHFKKFKKNYDINVEHFRDGMNNIVERNIDFDIKTLLQKSLDMISSHKGSIGILDMLHNMREYDDSTFTHCMNVALICNVFANWLKMSSSDVELATACGLFHDIGKLLVPHDIISKPAKLSDAEFSLVRKHPVTGYQLLLPFHLDNHILNSALMHHERNDGSGYPLRLKGSQIDKFASIVAIADVYDAMTAARVYRGPLCPFKVIEILEEEGFQKYNVEYVLIFLENVVNTYIRSRCRLSDGREGDIVFINKQKLSKPVIKCGTQYVDLTDFPDLHIACLL